MIDLGKAEKIVRKVFINARVVDLSLYKKGMINRNFLVLTSKPDREFILRVYPKDNWKAEKERFVYSLISEKIDIPLPRVFLIDTSKNIIGCSYLLLSKINGEELDIAYKKSSNISLIETAGRYLAMIHSIKMPLFGWIMDNGISPSFERWTDFLEYDLNEKLSKLEMINQFPSEFVAQCRDFFRKKKNLLETDEKPCLLHKDYHYSHIIADEKGINGIIDVEWAIAGHNEMDIVKSVMWMFDIMPELEEHFLRGYLSIGRLSGSFNSRRQIYEFLILISSVSLSFEYGNTHWVRNYLKRLGNILRMA